MFYTTVPEVDEYISDEFKHGSHCFLPSLFHSSRTTPSYTLDPRRGDNFSRDFRPISCNIECIWPLKKHIRCEWVFPQQSFLEHFSTQVQTCIIFWYIEKPAEGQRKAATSPWCITLWPPFNSTWHESALHQCNTQVPSLSCAVSLAGWHWAALWIRTPESSCGCDQIMGCTITIFICLYAVKKKESLSQSTTKIYMIIYWLWQSNCPLQVHKSWTWGGVPGPLQKGSGNGWFTAFTFNVYLFMSTDKWIQLAEWLHLNGLTPGSGHARALTTTFNKATRNTFTNVLLH